MNNPFKKPEVPVEETYLYKKLQEIHEMGELERKRVRDHSVDCFDPYKYQSCGCDAQGIYSGGIRTCVSHQRNKQHTAYLMEETLKVQKRLADALEKK